MIPIIKAHAYGNDFILVPRSAVPADGLREWSRRLCARHEGIGADGVIYYAPDGGDVSMTLYNADGSLSELSGNGLRCLAAHLAREGGLRPGASVAIITDAGPKHLALLDVRGSRYTFRTGLGPPEGLRVAAIDVAGETIRASVLRVGNPQCVVLGPLPAEDRFRRLGRVLAVHPVFPEGTNVEFAEVEAPDRIRILIWERGVGPTASSGTGTAAAAVAAAAHGGAARTVHVAAPGGTQLVEWVEAGVFLTGWAEVVLTGTWVREDGA